MNQALPFSVAVTLALLVALSTFCRQVEADTGAECRQEAEMYGIPPEQFEEYVDGCVLSRGGYTTVEPDPDTALPDSAAEYAEQPVDESGVVDSGEGAGYVTQ